MTDVEQANGRTSLGNLFFYTEKVFCSQRQNVNYDSLIQILIDMGIHVYQKNVQNLIYIERFCIKV